MWHIKSWMRSKKVAIGLSYVLVIAATAAAILLIPALRYTPLVEPTVHDIDPVEFNEKFSKNPDDYVFLDVRSADAYNRLHATGSKLQPLHTLYTERLVLPRNTDKTIVLICSGAIASGVAYSYLEHYGFRNILRIEGGIENWKGSGMPVEGTDVLR